MMPCVCPYTSAALVIKNEYPICARMPTNEIDRAALAHFLRKSKAIHPRAPPHTAMAKAAVTQAGVFSIKTT